MTTVEEIKNRESIALREYGKAEAELKQWKEGENGGMWLEDLRGKVRRKEQLDEDDKRQLERLEKEKKSLEAEKKRWGDQVEYLQKKLVEFGEGKGNEQ